MTTRRQSRQTQFFDAWWPRVIRAAKDTIALMVAVWVFLVKDDPSRDMEIIGGLCLGIGVTGLARALARRAGGDEE